MIPARDDSSIWEKHHKERGEKKRTGKRFNRWIIVLFAGYFLIGAACWAILAIYGPVLAAEVGYQWRTISQIRGGDGSFSLLPRWSFDPTGMEYAKGYGLVIPKIFVNEAVVINVDPNDSGKYRPALQEGIAHAAGTALPGQGGLGYYFAHSSGMRVLAPQKKAMFYLLGKLEANDEVIIYGQGQKYTYRVVEKRVTDPNDLSFLEYTGEVERIVLQTCWPIGTSLQRLLVTAERIL